MKKIVIKFGGSNLKSTKDYAKLVEIVKAYNQPVIIVLSAFYGVTNEIVNICDKRNTNIQKITDYIDSLNSLKTDIIEQTIKKESVKKEVDELVWVNIEKLEKLIICDHYSSNDIHSLKAEILSIGEKLNAIIFNGVLKSNGLESELCLPEDIGLLTDGDPLFASINLEQTKKNINKNVDLEKINVIPGFYGVSKSGKINTLGRGGTDYTASAIANCVDAKTLHIWKDVKGFMTADPGIIKKAATLPSLTYEEAAELAYFGAKIFHPRTVEPVSLKDIPVEVFNVQKFEGKIIPGTIVNSKSKIKDTIIKSITYSNDFGIIRLKGVGVGLKPGVLQNVTKCLYKQGINIKSMMTSQVNINIFLESTDIDNAYHAIKLLDLSTITDIEKISNITVIAVVGEGMREKYGVAANIFQALAKHRINIEIFSLGASKSSSYFIVKQHHVEQAIKEIHKKFIVNEKEEEKV